MMELILVKTMPTLGKIGDYVKVKNGYALNYLIPSGYALRSTKENLAYFNEKKQELIEDNLKSLQDVQSIYDNINNTSLVFIRQASEMGQLYGGVQKSDVAESLSSIIDKPVHKNQIQIPNIIKSVGIHYAVFTLHPELHANIILNVSTSDNEARKQWKAFERSQQPQNSDKKSDKPVKDKSASDQSVPDGKSPSDQFNPTDSPEEAAHLVQNNDESI